MRNKTLLVSFMALFALVFALSVVSAGELVTIDDIKVNGISLMGSSNVAGIDVSETVPVEIYFTANKDASDVRARVYVEGYRDTISDETDRFAIIGNSTYVKRFNVNLPSSMDVDNLAEDLSLLVRISAKGEESEEVEYAIKLQKELYRLDILSIDAPDKVTAGSTIAVDVVIQNDGQERLDNAYVKASIPQLGVQRSVYAADLEAVDEDTYDNIRNSVEKRIYLTIPRNAIPGNYDIEVETYNYDTAVTAKKRIVVEGVQGGVLPTVTTRTISGTEQASFDVVLVNPNERMVVYSITPDSAKGLIVEVSEPITAVSADSSKTVKVMVRATDSADAGAHVVTVNVNSESGETKQISFTVNVDKTSGSPTTTTGTNNTVLILTVVLSIIFVVLLVILIVLLTRKPQESEEFGETSYY